MGKYQTHTNKNTHRRTHRHSHRHTQTHTYTHTYTHKSLKLLPWCAFISLTLPPCSSYQDCLVEHARGIYRCNSLQKRGFIWVVTQFTQPRSLRLTYRYQYLKSVLVPCFRSPVVTHRLMSRIPNSFFGVTTGLVNCWCQISSVFTEFKSDERAKSLFGGIKL